ncbi:putative NmrA-like family domain-containing protein 1 [Cadophora sp. DSE1049]|nr:putative NmrA-like family domain-containing protein 1 [Cadophora sp. DSE1049]
MAAKKVLVVFGATGVQGGSVVKAILGDSKMRENWTVRGVTRDVTKPSSKALESLGAETVAADLNNASTLQNALKGAYAVYAVTNYWESHSAEVEMKQGKAMADAAKEAGVQHFVWSSLMNISELSKGVLTKVLHFDSKAHIEQYIRGTGMPATYFMPGFYMSNIPGSSFRQVNGDWTFVMPIPSSTPIPLLNTADDVGKFVKGILLNREKIVKEFKEQFPEAGKTAKAVELPHQVYKDILGGKGMPPKAQDELLENMRLLSEFGYYGGDSLDESHSILVDKLTTWKEFMATKAPAFADLK